MTGDFQVRQDLKISGGASYTAAIYKGFPEGLTVNGAPPSASPIPNSWAEKTPHWTYNFYTRYDRAEGYLKGFGAGFGLSWQGKRLGSNGARTFAAPDPSQVTGLDTADLDQRQGFRAMLADPWRPAVPVSDRPAGQLASV